MRVSAAACGSGADKNLPLHTSPWRKSPCACTSLHKPHHTPTRHCSEAPLVRGACRASGGGPLPPPARRGRGRCSVRHRPRQGGHPAALATPGRFVSRPGRRAEDRRCLTSQVAPLAPRETGAACRRRQPRRWLPRRRARSAVASHPPASFSIFPEGLLTVEHLSAASSLHGEDSTACSCLQLVTLPPPSHARTPHRSVRQLPRRLFAAARRATGSEGDGRGKLQLATPQLPSRQHAFHHNARQLPSMLRAALRAAVATPVANDLHADSRADGPGEPRHGLSGSLGTVRRCEPRPPLSLHSRSSRRAYWPWSTANAPASIG